MHTKRVDKFHGNIAAWRNIADIQIDYFTQFVRAWIPFNAWFSTSFSNEKSDRDILTRVKNENNVFKDKIIFFLTRNNEDSKIFLTQLGKLHLELYNNPIPSKDRWITFTNVVIQKNSLPLCERYVKGKNYNYKIIVTYNYKASAGVQKINVQVLDILAIGSQGRMNWNQNEWDLDELKSQGQFKLDNIPKEKVRNLVRNEIVVCYNEINPLKPTNLILQPVIKGKVNTRYSAPQSCIVIDSERQLYFKDNCEDIAKAIIEVLYNLRNALFHGEINPSDEVQRIYKEAYNLLYPLIKVLN